MFFKKQEKKTRGEDAPQEAPEEGATPEPAGKKDAGTQAPEAEAAAEQALEERKPLTEGEIRERQKEGWIRALITFELVGKPKEHIERTLRAYLENIKNDGRIVTITEEYADALEHEDGLFSAFCETEAIVEDLETFTWLAVNFMPASIEVIEPEQVPVLARVVTNWYNDLLSKLHETSNILREERAVNQHLTESLNALIKNSVLSALRDGPKGTPELEKLTGIRKEQLAPFIANLLEKKRMVQRGKTYALR